ncbi:styrene monooxygenase/indole monooxygenase family protein [Sphingopyxis sp. MSC1_008]|jgi:2-polyprenyl-6-methoxyphenol hydroxylase-like FAD-dependent oxidoreductase|uniref:styrene monooxygenase/indole monooxygenase family protein n=1 Tax=Sphingopyxis sp. MSC1_008 TaxID=2909265 RepID=UPI0020C0512F|nr:styrene monooxygenase/indole monooxygenase family protein [Sphingopyxis sp. MSC1_008]
MRRISIIGSGQAGLILAHSLVGRGYDVTLYSDKTADEWLHASRPTGTAYLFAESLQIERDIGIDHWSNTMHKGQGMHVEMPLPDGSLLSIVARTARPGGAVDQRMKFHRWMNDLDDLGGRIVIETVDVAAAERIAAQSDLTILAVGKGDLGRIVARDPARSVYERPARNLAMGIVTNIKGWESRSGITAVKYSKLPFGEIFWVPFTHKTAGPSWSFIVEAIPGGALDKFGGAASGPEVVETVRGLVREFAAWDEENVGAMRYVEGDDLGWLVGAFPPTVRQAFGRLPSGALVVPVGDSAITFDPIGGHGGNNASHHARHLADEIIARNVMPFDAAWATEMWERYWESRGRHAYRFNNMFLESDTPGLATLLQASARDPRVADAMLGGNVMTPRNFFPWIESAAETESMIAAVQAQWDVQRA